MTTRQAFTVLGLLVLLPVAFGLTVASVAADRLISWMNRMLDRAGL